MNSFERRSVHTLLSEDPDIITDSEGEGVNRHIVIRKR
jgi:predicted RNA-binding protein Jag